jgi:hypothetical protein
LSLTKCFHHRGSEPLLGSLARPRPSLPTGVEARESRALHSQTTRITGMPRAIQTRAHHSFRISIHPRPPAAPPSNQAPLEWMDGSIYGRSLQSRAPGEENLSLQTGNLHLEKAAFVHCIHGSHGFLQAPRAAPGKTTRFAPTSWRVARMCRLPSKAALSTDPPQRGRHRPRTGAAHGGHRRRSLERACTAASRALFPCARM